MTTRTPVETRTPRMEPLARLPVFFALAGKRAVIAGGSAAAAWKAELLAAAGASVDVYAANARRGDDSRSPRRRASPFTAATSLLPTSPTPRWRSARSRTTAKPPHLPHSRAPQACRSMSSTSPRSAISLRRHRQPLATRHRHLHGRRSARVRAGDPRQARSADPARLCALGGGGAAMASARAGARAFVPRAAPFLGALHRACGGRTRAHAVIERHRCTDGRRARRRANSRLRHSRRRRPRRPRTAHACARCARCNPPT